MSPIGGLPEFIPAAPRRRIVRLFEQFNRFLLLPWLGIVEVELPDADLARLRALPPEAGIVLASNHPAYTDPAVILEVTRRWGRICTYTAARELFDRWGGWMGTFLRPIGAFSVFRGGGNRSAAQFAQKTIRAARYPVVVFPEGHTSYLNDVILPLKPGVAAWSWDAAATPGAPPIFLVPLVIKYRYTEPVEGILEAAVNRLERAVLHAPEPVPPGDVWSRLYLRLHRLGHVILARQERHHGYQPRRWADLDERVAGLCAHILRRLEISHLGAAQEGEFFDRARRLMARLGEETPQHYRDAVDARFAWTLSTFYAGYLTPESSPERFVETVAKLQREITRHVPLSLRVARTAHVRIGRALDVAGYLPTSAASDAPARRQATAALLADLAESLRAMIDRLQTVSDGSPLPEPSRSVLPPG